MAHHRCDYYDAEVLVERLTYGVKKGGRPVVFLVGSALTAPAGPGETGVPGVAGVIDLIREELEPEQLSGFDTEVSHATNPYQAAFLFLIGRQGQEAANDVVKKAVSRARRPIRDLGEESAYALSASTSDEACAAYDADIDGWHLTKGVRALGQLAAQFPKHFGSSVLTTNFDPLIGTAISVAGGKFYRTVLPRDGDLSQTQAPGCHVVHLHGYWYGSDTLHTPRQLTQARPRLKASLSHLLQGRTLVVTAYGGWDDVFVSALLEVLQDDQSHPEVAWTFFQNDPTSEQALLDKLAPGLDRGRITLYGGVNCHSLLPALADRWASLEDPAVQPPPRKLPPMLAETVATPPQLIRVPEAEGDRLRFNRGKQDRPPIVDFYVGRREEIELLRDPNYAVGFITGVGGQGKSALAARYFLESEGDGRFDYCIWRDCKEETERFENQVRSVVEVLAGHGISSSDLSMASMGELAELMVSLAGSDRLLMVFDNIDQYVDLENDELIGSVLDFVEQFLATASHHRVLFTCRPSVEYKSDKAFPLRLRGIDIPAAKDLFKARGAKAPEPSIELAQEQTGGHAFWLSLIAAQVAERDPAVTVEQVLGANTPTASGIPASTLESIWRTLKDREQTVLRALAEMVRPMSDLELADVLRRKVNFNQISRAMRRLKSLNLLVVKSHGEDKEVIELHPVVRAFIRNTFAKSERNWYIDALITVYSAFVAAFTPESFKGADGSPVERWTEAAELYVERGKYRDAFKCLGDVSATFSKGGDASDFVRVARLLFSSVDWRRHRDFSEFDELFNVYFNILAIMGRHDECNLLLEKYRETVPKKDARYINFCDRSCYYHWLNENYLTAVRWGTEGVQLKSKSDVDTGFDAQHNLALSQRDSGAIDPALAHFLGGAKLKNIVDPDEFDKTKDGSFYGNIGRCLHLMGQIGPALICYRKSAIALERARTSDHVTNQGYIRQWIGELLLARDEASLAKEFLIAALGRWHLVSPPKASRVRSMLDIQGVQPQEISDNRIIGAENAVREWIYRGEVSNGSKA